MSIILIVDGTEYECILKKKEEKGVTEEEERELMNYQNTIQYFNRWKNKFGLLKCLLNNNTITREIIYDTMNCTQSEAIEVISKLSQAAYISKRGNYYVKTNFCTELLRVELSKIE